jgi:predicted RNase H-like nuclease (RuvC/YqgF family)
MSTIQEKIQEEIKKLQAQRDEWDKAIKHYQMQIDKFTEQYRFMGLIETSLRALLTPTVGEVVKPEIPPLSEIQKAHDFSSVSRLTLRDALFAVLASYGNNAAPLSVIERSLRSRGYESKSKNIRTLLGQCLNDPKNRKAFKRVSKGVYTLATRKGKA